MSSSLPIQSQSVSHSRTSAELFFTKAAGYGYQPPFDLSAPFSCPPKSRDLSDSPQLDIQEIDTLMNDFATNHQLFFPHYTVSTPYQCHELIVRFIKDASQKPFDADKPLENRCTVITTLSGSPKEDLLADAPEEHKTTFYLERTAPTQFTLVSLDSIEAVTPRRLMQAIQTTLESLSNADENFLLDTYRATPCRQYNDNSCGVFAVHNTLTCHRTTNLIEQLHILPSEKFTDHDRDVRFPPAFMVSSEDFTPLTEYLFQVGPLSTKHPLLKEELQKLITQVASHTKQGENEPENTCIQELFKESLRRLSLLSTKTPPSTSEQ